MHTASLVFLGAILLLVGYLALAGRPAATRN